MLWEANVRYTRILKTAMNKRLRGQLMRPWPKFGLTIQTFQMRI
jgi:hypothetical protein